MLLFESPSRFLSLLITCPDFGTGTFLSLIPCFWKSQSVRLFMLRDFLSLLHMRPLTSLLARLVWYGLGLALVLKDWWQTSGGLDYCHTSSR